MKKKTYPIDLSALAYPMMQTRKTQSNFHFEAELCEEVDPRVLTASLTDILTRYPIFKTKIVSGFLWHVFREHDAPMIVKEDDRPPLLPLRDEDTNGYPFRLAYSGKKIVLEIFHAVTDADVGALFLSDLLTRYAEIKEGATQSEVPDRGLVIEDAFLRYGKKKKLSEISLKSYNNNNKVCALGDLGSYRPYPELLSLELPLDRLKAVAKENGATITEYVTAAYISAILNGQPLPPNKALCIFIPINLRRFFPSDTMQNFVCFERAYLPKGDTDLSFSHILSVVHEEFTTKITQESMQAHVDDVRRALTLPLLKYTPLFIKHPTFKFVKTVFNKVRQTAILSNIGTMTLPARAEKQVRNMKFFLNIGKNAPINLAISTYNGICSINITNDIEGRELPDRFFAFLEDQCKK